MIRLVLVLLLCASGALAQTAPVFTGPTGAAAQKGDPIKQQEMSAAFAAKVDYSGPMGVVPDPLKVTADGFDDAPSIQRALGQACASTSHILRLRARIYRIASAITQPCAVHWIGQGWQEPSGGTGVAVPGLGTWLQIAGTGFTPVTITGPAAAGSVLEGFGVYQTHPAPAAGWTPTNYPYVFNVTGTNGEVTFRHIMGLAINKGITAFYAARLKVEGVRGQFFTNGIYADKNYDTTIIDDFRNWPYWSQDSSVMAYQQANMDNVILGRVDDSFLDRVFTFAARSGLKLVTTPADASNPAALPGGSPTNVMIGSIRSDFTRWTIWYTASSSAFDDVELAASTVNHQGAAWSSTINVTSSLVPLAGSAAIRNDGSFRLWSIDHLKADVLDVALVDASSATGASMVQIGRSMTIFSRSAASQCYLLLPGSLASTLQFALPPLVDWGTHTPNLQPSGSTGAVTWNRPS